MTFDTLDYSRCSKSEQRDVVPPLLPKGGEGRGEEPNNIVKKTAARAREAITPHPNPLPTRAGRGSRTRFGKAKRWNIQRPTRDAPLFIKSKAANDF